MNDHATDFSAEATEQHLQLAGGLYFTEDYVPSEDEPYMNPRQLEYFRRKLLSWREQLLKESGESLKRLREDSTRETDVLDQGTLETSSNLKLSTRDRCLVLVEEIDDALDRIQDGSYGYCDETGEQIGLKRLEARPTATLSIEAQEWRERGRRRKARWNLAYA
ncbi:MAG: RNA polymerase-binding protein DksA [Desulfobacteraceae bacterium]|jgi:DnaK suppressor protein